MFLYKLFLFIRFKVFDFKKLKYTKSMFKEYGLKMFCGRQGAGKTVSMVWYLNNLRKKYPNLQIYTNFDYAYATGRLTSLNDLMKYRNGTDGIVFAIDELQNEFSSSNSRDFPADLLSVVTMQRKQRICILATSQVFGRVAKPLREQCHEVIECGTFMGRWTRMRAYDAIDYNKVIDNPDPERRWKLPKLWRDSFVQTEELRECYDTYAVIERMRKSGVSSRQW